MQVSPIQIFRGKEPTRWHSICGVLSFYWASFGPNDPCCHIHTDYIGIYAGIYAGFERLC